MYAVSAADNVFKDKMTDWERKNWEKTPTRTFHRKAWLLLDQSTDLFNVVKIWKYWKGNETKEGWTRCKSELLDQKFDSDRLIYPRKILLQTGSRWCSFSLRWVQQEPSLFYYCGYSWKWYGFKCKQGTGSYLNLSASTLRHGTVSCKACKYIGHRQIKAGRRCIWNKEQSRIPEKF